MKIYLRPRKSETFGYTQSAFLRGANCACKKYLIYILAEFLSPEKITLAGIQSGSCIVKGKEKSPVEGGPS